MLQYDQYGQPYDDGAGNGYGDAPTAPATTPTAGTQPYAGEPAGFQGIDYWAGQGYTTDQMFGANGQMNQGWSRTANGYDYQQPQQGGGGGGLGSMAFMGKPDYTSLKPFSLKPTTQDDLYADPSYQSRLNEGRQALEQSASGRGTLRTGGTLKDILGYGQTFASREYQNVDERRFRNAKAEYEPTVLDWQGQNRAHELEFNRSFEAAMSLLDDDYRYAALGAGI